MSALAKVLFVLGVLAFLISAAVAGTVLGDILWRAGMAVMLTDLLLVQLWPERKQSEAQPKPVAAGG